MNILFVCHNDFASNSMNHITGFATGLAQLGHAAAVAIPDHYAASRDALPAHRPFQPILFSDMWKRADQLFPDRQSADVIHAWTPRENVRVAVEKCRAAIPTADLVVHLEDNEQHLSETFARGSHADLRHLANDELSARLPLNLAHPRKYLDFLRGADGVTGIVAELADFTPPSMPFVELWPAVDFEVFHPGPADLELRASLGIRAEEKILCYTGNSHFANGSEMRSLYEAVFLLNRGGSPCRLIRTGVDGPDFARHFPADELARHVLHLGFVAADRLPALLRLADVLVQPGDNDGFNTHRLPSKLPEFLASGRPVIMPRVNVGLRVQPGEEALVMDCGTPEEIARNCARVFTEPGLAERLSSGAAAFARRHFDLARNTRVLADFYAATCLLWQRPPPGPASAALTADRAW